MITMDLNEDDALAALKSQLASYADQVDAARKLLDQGNVKEAYRMFPYRDYVGKNLEAYVNDTTT